MTKFIGRRGELGLAVEASRGTALVPTEWLGRNTISFDDKTTTARNEQGLGRIEDSDGNHVVGKHAEGEFEYDVEDRQLGVILTSLLGASPVSAGGPTYTHTYTLQNTNLHQSLSLTYQDPDVTTVFPNCVVNNFALKVEPEGIVKANVGFMSSHGRGWTSQTADFTNLGQKFLHQHLKFKLAANIAGLSGASVISLKGLELNINSNTALDNVMGTVAPEDIVNQQYSVEGTITLNKEDQTYRDYMLDGTYRSMEVILERAADSKLQFQLPRVDFSEWEQDRSLNELTTQSINFKGNYDAANALAIISTAVLTNTYAGTNY